MKSAVLVFPGINRERDMARTLRLVSGVEPAMVWHAETGLPSDTDLVVVPGGWQSVPALIVLTLGTAGFVMPSVPAIALERKLGRWCLDDPDPAGGRALRRAARGWWCGRGRARRR